MLNFYMLWSVTVVAIFRHGIQMGATLLDSYEVGASSGPNRFDGFGSGF